MADEQAEWQEPLLSDDRLSVSLIKSLPHKDGLFSHLQQMFLPRNRLVCEVLPQQTKYVERCLFVE